MAKLVESKPLASALASQESVLAATHIPVDATELAEEKSNTARLGLIALVVGFGGFLLWAAFAPLDQGVPSQGIIAIDTKKKAVQHLTGGLIREVLVGEGAHVKEGQLLMRLDEALARSNFETARQHYFGLIAIEGRLLAEQRGKSKIEFRPVVSESGYGDDGALRQQLVDAQAQLLASRQASLAADLQAIEESIQGQIAQIDAYETILVNRKKHAVSLAEELSNTIDLVKEYYAPRIRYFDL